MLNIFKLSKNRVMMAEIVYKKVEVPATKIRLMGGLVDSRTSSTLFFCRMV